MELSINSTSIILFFCQFLDSPKMKEDSLSSRLPKELRDKLARGKELLQSEIDKFAVQQMRKHRKEMTITDIIYNINRGKRKYFHYKCV